MCWALQSDPDFITQKMEERIKKERDLWRAIPIVLDLQCWWQLLLQSANSPSEPHDEDFATKSIPSLLPSP